MSAVYFLYTVTTEILSFVNLAARRIVGNLAAFLDTELQGFLRIIPKKYA